MGLVLTNNTDTVEVKVETPGGDFNITVGTIPYEIGREIDDLSIGMLKVVRKLKAGEDIEEATLDAKQIQSDINLLYLEYGLRGHSGLEDAQGKELLCETILENGHTVLSGETMNLYKSNTQFLGKVSGKISRIKKVGIGNYISELAKGKSSDEIEEAVCGGAVESSPLAKELEESLLNSMASPTQNKQP